jgi:hypothetical protein
VLSTTSARADTTYYVDATFPSPQTGGVVTGYLTWNANEFEFDGGVLTATGFSLDNGEFTYAAPNEFAGPDLSGIVVTPLSGPTSVEIFFNAGQGYEDAFVETTLSTTPPTTSITPEPGSLLLLATGLIGCLSLAWTTRRRSQPCAFQN